MCVCLCVCVCVVSRSIWRDQNILQTKCYTSRQFTHLCTYLQCDLSYWLTTTSANTSFWYTKQLPSLLSPLHILYNFVYHFIDTEKLPINETLPSKPSSEEYNSDELDLLALFCTLVKILYVVGCLEFISPLIALISTHTLCVCFCFFCLMGVEYFDSNDVRWFVY